MPKQKEEMPVYLFTGFLEAGKTQFISGVLKDPQFTGGERTLLLVCEEGENEYDKNGLTQDGVFVESIENESDLTPKVLEYLEDKHKATRILVEYNGMWLLQSLFTNMPPHWTIYQEFLFIDATTFTMYNANMRNLMVDKLASCDLAVFNRVTQAMDKMEFHKQVRGVSRRAQIAYEYEDGTTEYDEMEDPLPFDLEAPVVKIEDEDYAIWYRDLAEEMKKYSGKVLEVKGQAVLNRRSMPGVFAFGRRVMTCCVEDIQFASFLATCTPQAMPQNGQWYVLRCKVQIKFHKLYGQKGPVLQVMALTPCDPPEEEVATFF